MGKGRSSTHSFTTVAIKQKINKNAKTSRIQQPHLHLNLINMMNDAAIICDASQHILFWNHGAERLYGWKETTVKGFVYHELLHSQFNQDNSANIETLRKQKYWEGELTQIRKDGTYVLVKSKQTIIKNAEDHNTNILYVNQNITEQKQHETNHHLKQVLESIHDAFFHLDTQWRFTYINQQAENIIRCLRKQDKCSQEPLLGQSIWEALPQLVGTRFEQKFLEVAKTRTSTCFEDYTSTTHQWFNIHVFPNTEGISAYYSDITTYKMTEIALRESEAKFKWLLDTNIIGISIVTRDGKILDANATLLSMLGFAREDLTDGNLNWKRLTPIEYHEQDQLVIDELSMTGVCRPVKKEFYNKCGARVPVLLIATTVSNQNDKFAALVVDMAGQQEVEKQKETFMSIVGHELRTPLTAINGSIQLAQRRLQRFLRDGSEGLTPDVQMMIEKHSKLLEQTLRQTRIQNRLINDLLDISRLAVDKLEIALQPSELIRIVTETVEDLRCTEGNHRINLKLPDQPRIITLVDSDRIGQVLANYINNAMKYSDPFEPVTVEIAMEEQKVQVFVHDRGPGLSEEAQKHIWESFYRTEKAKDQQGTGVNLGLGLHICKILIQRHQGQVGVISKENEGSSFWFSLPLYQNQTVRLDEKSKC